MRIHPELDRLLHKYSLSIEDFHRRGRLPSHLSHVKALRSAIITDLHERGTPWLEMVNITGCSLGTIQRLTTATWNKESKKNRQESAARVGASRRGETKPWLTAKLKRDWEEGKFDLHVGRERTPEEKEKLREASARPEVKAQRSRSAKARWQNPAMRKKLMDFHRDPKERARRSRLQVIRLEENPSRYLRGRCSVLKPLKCSKDVIRTRSSYETAAVAILDADPTIDFYDFEPRATKNGRYFLPDFVVYRFDRAPLLIEVKSKWVLDLPEDHEVRKRLALAEEYASDQGWEFAVWTEKELSL